MTGLQARRPGWNLLRALLWWCVWCLCAVPVRAGVSLQWQDGDSDVDRQVMAVLADSNVLSDFVALVDENFALEPPLVLALGAAEGPSIDVVTHVLSLPHEYLARAIETQAELVDDRDEALQRALNVVEYTLYHLLGHVLAGDTDVNADDRAEALSTWVMLSHWPNGGEQWYVDAQAFGEASRQLDGPLDDFWHEHALYRLRQDQLECWILGRDPAAYERLMPATLKPLERRRRCQANWMTLSVTVRRQLEGGVEG